MKFNLAQSKKRIFSISEAAELLGVSTKTLRRWEAQTGFEVSRTSGGQRRYTKTQLELLQQTAAGELGEPISKACFLAGSKITHYSLLTTHYLFKAILKTLTALSYLTELAVRTAVIAPLLLLPKLIRVVAGHFAKVATPAARPIINSLHLGGVLGFHLRGVLLDLGFRISKAAGRALALLLSPVATAAEMLILGTRRVADATVTLARLSFELPLAAAGVAYKGVVGAVRTLTHAAFQGYTEAIHFLVIHLPTFTYRNTTKGIKLAHAKAQAGAVALGSHLRGVNLPHEFRHILEMAVTVVVVVFLLSSVGIVASEVLPKVALKIPFFSTSEEKESSSTSEVVLDDSSGVEARLDELAAVIADLQVHKHAFEKITLTSTYFSSLDAGNLTGKIADSDHLDGISSSSFLRSDESDTAGGAINFTAKPGSSAVSGGPVYINPAASTAGYTLFGVAINDSLRFKVDAEGDVTLSGDLTVTGGDITLGTTSIFSGGDTASLNNIDAIDATTETTIEAAIDTLANLTSAAALATVGTITTGVWQGTAVADTYVANDLTISGGTVNNTVIGGTTAAAGTLTNLSLTGNSNQLVLQSAGVTGTITWTPATTNKTLTIPNVTGTAITTGDTGTVTNTMLAGSIAASKLVGTDIATVGTITSGTWTGTSIADANVDNDITIDSTKIITTTLTTEQLRLAYDASNYLSFTVGSTGGVTLNATGAGAAFTVSDAVSLSSTLAVTGNINSTGGALQTNSVTRIDNAGAGTLASLTLTTDLAVADGGTGASTLTDGGVLLGAGTAAITSTGVLAKGSIIVGDGVTAPVALAVGTNNQVLTADSAQASGLKWAAGGGEEASQIVGFAAACPTGWTEYTAARGRSVVGTPASGTNAATVGTALTNSEDRTHTHTGPSHQHRLGITTDGARVNMPDSAPYGTSGTRNSTRIDAGTLDSGNNSEYLSEAAGTGATGTAATSNVMPYIQLTYCSKDAGADYAEWTLAPEHYEPGTVVSIDPSVPEGIIMSHHEYDPTMVGVVSGAPGWTVGVETTDSVQLALNGRVPVKVDPDSEEIKPGDFITSSENPGWAKKATRMGRTIGIAMEEWEPGTTKQHVVIFLNLGYYLGGLADDGNLLTIDRDVLVKGNIEAQEGVFEKLLVKIEAMFTKIIAEVLEVKEVFAQRITAEEEITARAGVVLATEGERPACDTGNRGKIWFIQKETGDRAEICILDENGNYRWGTISIN